MNSRISSGPAAIVLLVLSLTATDAEAGTITCGALHGGSFVENYEINDLDLVPEDKPSEALPLLEKALLKSPDDVCLVGRHVHALVQLGRYDEAIEAYSSHSDRFDQLQFIARDVGKAFFEREDYYKAQYLYEEAFSYDSSDAEALRGIVLSSCKLDDYVTAYRYLDQASGKKQIAPYILTSLRIYLMQQMGTPELALQFAREAGSISKDQIDNLRVDTAAERVKWDEFDVALQILEQELQADPGNTKARSEYIVALSRKKRMEEVLEQYRAIENTGQPPAYQVTEAVADALTYLRRPKEAEGYYRSMVEQKQALPFKGYIGLYNTYTTMREWEKADTVWGKIGRLIKDGKLNWMEEHEALTAKGWSLIAQDRLEEAEGYFEGLLREAGLDSGFRSGLGHVYYHRGWPSKALEQFEIAENVNPEDVMARVGHAQTLLKLERNYEARELATELYNIYPYDLHVKDLYETVRLKERPQVAGDARFIDEAPGTTEYRFQLIATTPITPVFKIFADILHMHNYENTGGDRFSHSWDRVGAGFSWLLVPGLTFTESGSWDYVKTSEFGSTTKVAWQPTDNFRTEAAYESFSLDVPIRARLAGVTGKTGMVNMHYHESDLREYALFLLGNWLSDGNFNPAAIFRFEQTVINRPGWKLQIGPEFYYGRYSKDQSAVDYFSPLFEYSILLKPILQIPHYDMYDKSFKSFVYADVGAYKEHGFSFYPIGSFAYGQEFRTSKSFGLRWTAGYGARVYDGRYTNVLQLLLTLNAYF